MTKALIEERELHVEASESYLSYAMSVIVGRALPDARDGLKPVHRRLLYAMHDLGLTHSKPFKKCARVVGEVLGKYHPHGDGAVYDALVRLAQDFSMREPLISGHGNFGSLDDDPAAAMRYTECRLRALTDEALLADLDKDTVDFFPTFDASQDEPSVLPAKVPLLLVNGASGIAVGIATRIPPHNLTEVVSGLVAMIRNPAITSRELMRYIPAPDFPTGGTVLVDEAATEAYETGKGHVTIRAKAVIEASDQGTSKTGKRKAGGSAADARQSIVITEVPYQTSKADIVERIAELVESKALDGVSDVRDESDREGMRVVVEVRRGYSAEAVLSQLYSKTKLQMRFPCNMVALKGNQPLSMGLSEMLKCFLDFRCEVVERRARFESKRALSRLHQVQGFLLAMKRMTDVIKVIREAADGATARRALMDQFSLSQEQADGVLGLTLRRLTALEEGSLSQEALDLEERVKSLQSLLTDHALVLAQVEVEALEVVARHGSPRRSAIHVSATSRPVGVEGENDSSSSTLGIRVSASSSSRASSSSTAALAAAREESALPDQTFTMTLSQRGFIKRAPRGKGVKNVGSFRSGDSLADFASLRGRDTILLVSPSGRVHAVRVDQVPESSPASTGSSLAQVLGTPANIQVAAMLHVTEGNKLALLEEACRPEDQPGSGADGQEADDGDEHSIAAAAAGGGVLGADTMYLVMATRSGVLKRTPVTANFLKTSKAGLVVAKVSDSDPICTAALCRGCDVLVLACSDGHALAFPASEVPVKGRSGAGFVKGLKVPEGESLIDMAVLAPRDLQLPDPDPDLRSKDPAQGESSSDTWLLVVSSSGLAKRVATSELRPKGRGGQGVVVQGLRRPPSKDSTTKETVTEAEDILVREDSPEDPIGEVESMAAEWTTSMEGGSQEDHEDPVASSRGSSSDNTTTDKVEKTAAVKKKVTRTPKAETRSPSEISSERMVAMRAVRAGDEVVVVTDSGRQTRLSAVAGVAASGRAARGAKITVAAPGEGSPEEGGGVRVRDVVVIPAAE